MELEKMTIRDINNKIFNLENQLAYWQDAKFRAFDKTQPQSFDLTKSKIGGGEITNKNDIYLITCETADGHIILIKEEIYRLSKYVENELKRMGEYEPLMRTIIELREIEKLPWFKISEKTNYSERQCRRIYKKYKKKMSL